MFAARALGGYVIMGIAASALVSAMGVMLVGHILLKPVKDRVFRPQYAAPPK